MATTAKQRRRYHRWMHGVVGITKCKCNKVRVNQLLMAVAFAIISIAYSGLAQAAQEQQRQGQDAVTIYQLDLPEQTLAAALNTLSEQADIQVLFPYDIARSYSISPIKGRFTIQQALVIMLHNTGLYGGLTDSGIIAIAQADINSGTNQNGKGKSMNTNTRKTLLASMVGLFAAGGMATATAQDQVGESASAQKVLEEIIVTSTRRETSLNDTALSVAAVSGEDIARRNLSEMNDYLRTVPGVNFVEVGVGNSAVVIRGLGVSPQAEGRVSSPTVGLYFGEVPLAAVSVRGGASDLKMIDLNRVEVMRGPQGTLFGSGGLAGAVRNIPNAPNLNELEGSLKTTYSNTAELGGGNSKFEGVVNIPLIEDVLAIRAVAYRHEVSGYVKNVAGTVFANDGEIAPGVSASTAVGLNGGPELYQNESDIGNATHKGGRISALWAPSDDLSITLQHAYQDAEQNGQPYVEVFGDNDYQQITLQFADHEGLAGEESGFGDEINITNLVLEYDLGWANLLSSSGWLKQDSDSSQDESSYGGANSVQLLTGEAESFTQEVRLASQLDGPIQYVAGVFYEDSEYSINNRLWASTDTVLTRFGGPYFPGSLLFAKADRDRTIEQLAFYGELSYQFNEQWELTVGGRQFDYERVTVPFQEGLFGSADASNTDKFDESGTSLKANLSYTPNEDTLIYAQWAEGFRLGNTNEAINPDLCDKDNNGILDNTSAKITDGFDSDTSENFELGTKLTLLDNRLQINAAVYRVDWEGIPLSVSATNGVPGNVCFQAITVNAGEARSQGFELETIYQVSQDLRLSLGGAYTNAELTVDAPELGGEDGDRLPSSPEYTFNIGLQYDLELAGYPSYISGDYARVGGFYNKLGETGLKTGDYGQVNMSIGIIFDSLNVELFAQNLTNEDALTHSDSELLDSRAYQLRPRTIGLNVGYQF